MSKATASGALGLAFASALSWLCCLPIASGAFGIALATLAATVGSWWFVLASASLVLLIVAVVQTLRGGRSARSDHCDMRNRARRRLLIVSVVGVLTLALLTIPWWSGEITAELRDLQDLDELRSLVDHDKSIPRLVLLLSPT